MEGRRRMAVSLVVLAMVAVAQGRESFIQPDGIGDLGHCAKRCGTKCALKLSPKRIAACFDAEGVEEMVGPCYAKCNQNNNV
ncbi:hypothetical protein CCACVL1_20752 [Corchorus capsularis]|uniref:Uncharacterized protein n=1 Tax=Corchorus capsularis TaxID=210143 RepID=A0A1R3H9Z5_COCAP|nr:hypothetical protein CCACVL1_20752 [Corchorus capsularis]